ncbi:MAG: HEAT repeat domain-containing protein [Bdellovibrionales bacterium]|nr:HEAT repeat domain-containing protein [Bdellovibrionales bacterium]
MYRKVLLSAVALCFFSSDFSKAAVSDQHRRGNDAQRKSNVRKTDSSIKKSKSRKAAKNSHLSKDRDFEVPKLKSFPENKVHLVLMALRLPRINRINALRQLGKGYAPILAALAFEKSESLQVRWRAVTSLGEAFPGQAQKTLAKALSSNEWYLRNAGLIGMTHVSRSRSLSWAGKLLDDPALVVRTAAVKTISSLNGQHLEGQLWRKLYSKENYNKGKSLWIRKHIAKTLSQFAKAGRESYFMRVLSDSDTSLHPYAINALETLHGKKAPENSTLEIQRVSWIKWWQSRMR